MVVFHLFQTVGLLRLRHHGAAGAGRQGYPRVSKSLLFTALTYLGYPVGSLLSLPLVDRVERKFLVLFALLGMAVFGLLFGFSDLDGSRSWSLASCTPRDQQRVLQRLPHPPGRDFPDGDPLHGGQRHLRGVPAGHRPPMPFVWLIPVLNNAGVGALFPAVVCVGAGHRRVDIGLLGPRTTGRALESVNEIPHAAGD